MMMSAALSLPSIVSSTCHEHTTYDIFFQHNTITNIIVCWKDKNTENEKRSCYLWPSAAKDELIPTLIHYLTLSCVHVRLFIHRSHQREKPKDLTDNSVQCVVWVVCHEWVNCWMWSGQRKEEKWKFLPNTVKIKVTRPISKQCDVSVTRVAVIILRFRVRGIVTSLNRFSHKGKV